MKSAARPGFNWAVFGLAFVLLACAGAGYVLSQPKLYRSSARLAFETDADFRAAVSDVGSAAFTRRVAERVVHGGGVGFAGERKPRESPDEPTVVRGLMRGRVVRLNRDSRTIDIGYQHENREVAATMARYFFDELFAAQGRRRIDEAMKQVEALVQLEKKQERRIESLKQTMAKAPGEMQTGAGEAKRSLAHDLRLAEQERDGIRQKLRGTAMPGGMMAPPFHMVGMPPSPADAGDYLRGPILGNLAWSLAGAVFLSLLPGFVFKNRLRRRHGCTEALHAKLFRPLGSSDVLVMFAVVSTGLTGTVLHALSVPRIYESSVTLAIEKGAMKTEGDELTAGDLRGWLPVVTQWAAGQFCRSDYALPLLGRRNPEPMAVESVLLKNLRATVNPESNTLTLTYRHEDFKVCAEVVDAFGRAYEMYSGEQERKNPGLLRQRLRQTTTTMMSELMPPPVQMAAKSGWAAPGDYLLAPIIARIACGFLVTLTGGMLVVGAFRMMSAASGDCVRSACPDSRA